MSGTEVYILGQKYTIKGDAPADKIKELARDINDRINEVCESFPNIAPQRALILTLFNLAGELNRIRTEHESIATDIEEKAAILASLVD
jgi:cell division protein ZapA